MADSNKFPVADFDLFYGCSDSSMADSNFILLW